MKNPGDKLELIGYEHWFYPVEDFVYNEAYMNKYRTYEDTTIGNQLNQFRVNLAQKYKPDWGIIDVGIGCGTFIQSFPDGYGYDVNPAGIDYLQKCGKWVDIYKEDISYFSTVTFFDSLEHIKEPDIILSRIAPGTVVIVSLPTFRDKKHILKSKHFRPDEHYHYFTLSGFLDFMYNNTYDDLEINSGEILAGREDIVTYVFEKT